MNKQLDEQRQIREAVSHVQQAISSYASRQLKDAQQEQRRLESQKQQAIQDGDVVRVAELNRQL